MLNGLTDGISITEFLSMKYFYLFLLEKTKFTKEKTFTKEFIKPIIQEIV